VRNLMIKLKRAYDPPAPEDGQRILVDRVWPRGLKKEQLQLDAWLRDLAPSTTLRKWFGHDPARWDEFERRYRAELAGADRRAQLADLAARARHGTVTLVFSARDTEHNQAVALRNALEDEGFLQGNA
jgi:uncharacterized protein YeaO (DUF488 family)